MNTRSGLVLSYAAKAALKARGATCSGTTASSSAATIAQRMPSSEPWKYWGLAILAGLVVCWAALGATVWGLMQAASVVFG